MFAYSAPASGRATECTPITHGDKKAGCWDIVDTAVACRQLRNPGSPQVQAAGLVDTFEKGEGPFTVFAPTDEAFAKNPQADLEALLAEQGQTDRRY